MPKTADKSSTYDEIPYPSHPFKQTHPERLYTIARLFGMQPVPPGSARILEIGCASGGNIIPLADVFHEASFVGIDLSQRQVDEGVEKIRQLDLHNICLQQADILDFHDEDGFDYIICHGVYSWVPPQVQERILEVCRDQLTPSGIAYVSYNTYPGWHMREMIRDMMCYHVDRIEGNEPKKIQQARALLQFLTESVDSQDSAYGRMLKSELDLLSKQSDNYLYHEHLETFNDPVYFHQFMDRASKFDLQYCADASLASMWLGNLPNSVAETLERVAPTLIQREQYVDFVRNRTFRQSLLCHKSVELNRNLDGNSVFDCYYAGRLGLRGGGGSVELKAGEEVSFVDAKTNRSINTSDPITKAALAHLNNAWPGRMSFADLFQASQLSVGSNAIQEATQVEKARYDLASSLNHLMLMGIVDCSFFEDHFAGKIASKPLAARLSRYQAEQGNNVTNLRHETVTLDAFSRHVLMALDGQKNYDEIVTHTEALVENGTLVVQLTEELDQQSRQDAIRKLLQANVKKSLESFLVHGLLKV
ncbi:MAG: methyltransferase-like protein/cyclopropane fatty-acyl-phospholipid synthase-like methyltransferase [Pirellulaceae bacterium]|jgi:methyltransferase-like protein/cyclopropane fatty-acyl-phospholipid synthase-like methyltransferase